MIPENHTLHVSDHQLAAICLNPQAVGEPVILLHGITSSVTIWQVNPAPFLLGIGPCYSLSLPGHYPALAPAAFKQDVLTAETLVRLMDEAIRRLIGDQPATLIGHSTGGFMALALAANRPEMARRVVSISGFARGRWTGVLGLNQAFARWGRAGAFFFSAAFRPLMLHPVVFRWAMRFYVADRRAFYAHPDLSEAMQRVYPAYCRLDLNALWPYFKHMPEIDITPQLARIQAPTLAITGDCDPIVPPEQSDHIVRQVPGASLSILPGAGHFPFTERAAAYLDCLSHWLAHHR
ncbi:MAG: alpha/beta fold hydrolase [Chloroflexota bacterium]